MIVCFGRVRLWLLVRCGCVIGGVIGFDRWWLLVVLVFGLIVLLVLGLVELCCFVWFVVIVCSFLNV